MKGLNWKEPEGVDREKNWYTLEQWQKYMNLQIIYFWSILLIDLYFLFQVCHKSCHYSRYIMSYYILYRYCIQRTSMSLRMHLRGPSRVAPRPWFSLYNLLLKVGASFHMLVYCKHNLSLHLKRTTFQKCDHWVEKQYL